MSDGGGGGRAADSDSDGVGWVSRREVAEALKARGWALRVHLRHLASGLALRSIAMLYDASGVCQSNRAILDMNKSTTNAAARLTPELFAESRSPPKATTSQRRILSNDLDINLHDP